MIKHFHNFKQDSEVVEYSGSQTFRTEHHLIKYLTFQIPQGQDQGQIRTKPSLKGSKEDLNYVQTGFKPCLKQKDT